MRPYGGPMAEGPIDGIVCWVSYDEWSMTTPHYDNWPDWPVDQFHTVACEDAPGENSI